MTRFARVDKNHNEIADDLRDVGASVQSLASVGGGVPDLLVGFRGETFLLEVKGKRGKLNKLQREWHADWRGQVAVVRSTDEALKAIGAI